MSGQKIIEDLQEAVTYAQAETAAVDAFVAQLRRLYHHAAHGGSVTAEDLSRVIKIVERFQAQAFREPVS